MIDNRKINIDALFKTENEETLYCAEIKLNFFNKKKSELVDERPPYEKNSFDEKQYHNQLFGEQTDEPQS